MKKQCIIRILTALTALLFPFPAAAVPQYSFSVSAAEDAAPEAQEIPFTYEETADKSGIVITKYTGTEPEVTVPPEIDGKPVTEIGSQAFFGSQTLETVTLPDSVECIASCAFFSCPALTDITLPANLRQIGQEAFEYCSALTEITIPERVEVIENYAFLDCTNLKSVTLPEDIEQIGIAAFGRTPWLTERQQQNPLVTEGKCVIDGALCEGSIEIPQGVTAIAAGAFSRNANLTAVILPESVTRIGHQAFKDCKALTAVTLPETVKEMGGSVFAGTPWLAEKQAENPLVIVNNILIDGTACTGSVAVPEGVTAIPDSAFINCKGLTAVSLPDSVTSIGGYAFYQCAALAEINLPDGITEIGGSAFSGCRSITSLELPENLKTIGNFAFQSLCWEKLIIPDGVTEIGNGAFSFSGTLKEAVLPASLTVIEGQLFQRCSALESVTIPYGVKVIEAEAFCDCTALRKIELPDSVTAIASHAFAFIYELEEVTIPANVTEIEDDAFAQCDAVTVRGYRGSYAETFAAEHHLAFAAIPEADAVTGDANGDGETDVSDAVILARFCAEDTGVTLTNAGLKNADADTDGSITPEDVIAILRIIAKIA